MIIREKILQQQGRPFRFNHITVQNRHACFMGYSLYELALQKLNTLRPKQNGRNFTDDILNAFSRNDLYAFRLTFH